MCKQLGILVDLDFKNLVLQLLSLSLGNVEVRQDEIANLERCERTQVGLALLFIVFLNDVETVERLVRLRHLICELEIVVENVRVDQLAYAAYFEVDLLLCVVQSDQTIIIRSTHELDLQLLLVFVRLVLTIVYSIVVDGPPLLLEQLEILVGDDLLQLHRGEDLRIRL